MAYHVEVTARAIRDLRRIYQNINAEYSKQAWNWFNGLESLVFSLEDYPSRGAITPEDGSLRHVLYGNKPHIYRIIYTVDEPAHVVTVLHIRHGARKNLTPKDASLK